MTKREFKKWFQGFRAAFASVDAWIGNLPETAGADSLGATQDTLTAAWYDILADVPANLANEATSRMASGRIVAPKAYQDFPREIRLAALRLGERPAPPGPRIDHDGNDTFECQICRDVGYVTVFSVEAMQAMALGEFQLRPPVPRYQRCVVRCTCKWGDYYSRSFPAAFDCTRMVKFEGSNTPRRADVRATA